MSKLELSIELGNAAMSNGHQVADAVKEAADYIEGIPPGASVDRVITDINGNTVGRFYITLPEAIEDEDE